MHSGPDSKLSETGLVNNIKEENKNNENITQDQQLNTALTSENKLPSKPSIQMFKCNICNLYTKFDYHGTRPVERHLLNRLDKEQLTEDELKEKSKLIDSIKNKKESIVLLEKCYVCDDPFSSVKSSSYLVLGANCFTCKQMTCMSNECSIFYYNKRFCQKCAAIHLENEEQGNNEFPVELKSEIIKLISSSKSND